MFATKPNSTLCQPDLSVALNYGGQRDIEQAARRMIADAASTEPTLCFLS